MSSILNLQTLILADLVRLRIKLFGTVFKMYSSS